MDISLHCMPGQTATTISHHTITDLTLQKPDVIVFHAGTNDLETSDTEDIIESHTYLILNVKKTLPNTQVVLYYSQIVQNKPKWES